MRDVGKEIRFETTEKEDKGGRKEGRKIKDRKKRGEGTVVGETEQKSFF